MNNTDAYYAITLKQYFKKRTEDEQDALIKSWEDQYYEAVRGNKPIQFEPLPSEMVDGKLDLSALSDRFDAFRAYGESRQYGIPDMLKMDMEKAGGRFELNVHVGIEPKEPRGPISATVAGILASMESKDAEKVASLPPIVEPAVMATPEPGIVAQPITAPIVEPTAPTTTPEPTPKKLHPFFDTLNKTASNGTGFSDHVIEQRAKLVNEQILSAIESDQYEGLDLGYFVENHGARRGGDKELFREHVEELAIANGYEIRDGYVGKKGVDFKLNKDIADQLRAEEIAASNARGAAREQEKQAAKQRQEQLASEQRAKKEAEQAARDEARNTKSAEQKKLNEIEIKKANKEYEEQKAKDLRARTPSADIGDARPVIGEEGFFNKVDASKALSFDLETSMLDPGRAGAFIWGTGYARLTKGNNVKKTGKLYKDNISLENVKSIIGSNDFGKEQIEKGRLNPLFESYESLDGQQNILGDFVDAAKKSKANILLIQNANFERRWMEPLMRATGADISGISDVMRMAYETGSGELPSFHPPGEVLEARSKAMAHFYSFLETGDETMFTHAAKAYEDIMGMISGHMSSGSKKMIVVDQLDLTRGLFMKAAELGYIDKKYANIGTAQSFLSLMLLGEEETHLAPDDASQTLRTAYKHIIPMYNELMSGVVSDKTKETLERISIGQKQEATSQLTRSLVRAFDEAMSPTGYGYYDSLANDKPVELTFRDTETGKLSVAQRIFKTSKKYIKGDLAFVAQDVLRRYHGIDTPGIDKDELLRNIINHKSPQESIDYINNLNKDVANISKNPIEAADGQILNWIKNNKIKATAIGAGLIGIGMMAFGGGTKEEIEADKNAKRQFTQSVDNNIRMYSKPSISVDTYHGSGFADWNERIGHHE